MASTESSPSGVGTSADAWNMWTKPKTLRSLGCEGEAANVEAAEKIEMEQTAKEQPDEPVLSRAKAISACVAKLGLRMQS